MKHICVIDPAIKEPATPCFNRLMARYEKLRFSYHLPALMGVQSLSLVDKPDAILVLGSASFIGDNLPWQKETFDYLREMLSRDVHVFGICFGHQLVAHGFGATIAPVMPDNSKLGTTRSIAFAEPFADLAAGVSLNIAVNHRQEIKSLSPDFQCLASSATVAHEMIRHRSLPFWGIQGHPEASPFFMKEYIGGLSDSQMTAAQEGGDIIIDNFFRAAHILE